MASLSETREESKPQVPISKSKNHKKDLLKSLKKKQDLLKPKKKKEMSASKSTKTEEPIKKRVQKS